MWVAFAIAKGTRIFFSKNFNVYAIFDDQCFNDTLTNDTINLINRALINILED